MAAWETLKNHQNALIRKTLEGSTFIAPTTSAAITALTGADSSLNALPEGYNDLGWMSDDGAQFSADVDSSDITSWGSVEPTRRDITSDVTTLELTLQETNKHTIGLYTGADMTAVIPDASSGEVAVSKPDRPPLRFWRVLTIGVDIADGGEIYIGRFLPRASVTDKDDQSFQSGDDEALGWPVTMTAYMDSTLGYSERYYFGGPGWEALLGSMGF
ncbi:phage tail protein [Streptomyces sp. NPDC007063]|uniref:phage tail tube protein n=1 Tax=Streptomyces sp. NPDC007063 TaxID=3364772 RepID=UPI0036A07061